MPLMKSKSPGAFKSNVKEMVHSGHPIKQALAAAYSVKRMAKRKKMASGGEVENEDLDPMHEPEHGAEDAVLKQMDYAPMAQNHDVLPEPREPKDHYEPAEEDLPAHMLARGGRVHHHYPNKRDKVVAEPGENGDELIDHNMSEPNGNEMIHMGEPPGMAKGGFMHPKHIVMAIMKKKAHGGMAHYDEGGDVSGVQSAQDSMRRAFGYAGGGETGIDSAQDSMRKAFNYPVSASGSTNKPPSPRPSPTPGYAQGGYLEPDYNYLAENDSYPDPDHEEHDVLDYDVDAPENKKAKRKQMIKKAFDR